jgi:excisionase family DNA binding protein
MSIKPEQFSKWLDSTFDQIEADQITPAAAIAEAERHALRLGAGSVTPTGSDKRATLDFIGRLLAWCRQSEDADRLLWDKKEAARRLSISLTTLEMLTKCGRIQCVRVGHAGDKDRRRLIRYTPAAIHQYVAEQQISA